MRPAATRGAAIAGILAAAAWLLIPGMGLAQTPPSAVASSQGAAAQDPGPQDAGNQDAGSQDAGSQDAGAGCFTVVMPAKGGAPHAPLLLDQCSGSSWLLVRDPVAPAHPGDAQAYRYRWFPLAIASTEAVMAETPASPPAPRSAAAAKPPATSTAAVTPDKRPPIKDN